MPRTVLASGAAEAAGEQRCEFMAHELVAENAFAWRPFALWRDAAQCWHLSRGDESEDVVLGTGYTLLRTLYASVCSTDLARHVLPFPLPQIIGHEAVGLTDDGKAVVVDINASHRARGLDCAQCPYCAPGPQAMHSQCPARITLGIDRLPGVFAPYFLAPCQNIVMLPQCVPPHVGVLIEPFAAALHAVEATPPRNGDRVCVVGPRRLGALILAALSAQRDKCKFELTALSRNVAVAQQVGTLFGCDHVVYTGGDTESAVKGRCFDVVFDTTGTQSGFELALSLAKRVMHLKSTSGSVDNSVPHMYHCVLEELSLTGARLPPSKAALAPLLAFTWPYDAAYRRNDNIFVDRNTITVHNSVPSLNLDFP
eukprot:TRINITY_DN1909_c0_g1_i1.p1 TRINITY_DN1909_c0_g1~~TRINITY_DN1909_c0_g1_i1.p1  ORF type:complete len:380 (-),score=48.73 TRINITY_DN1909_c0_g1_i1:1142-2248(-)